MLIFPNNILYRQLFLVKTSNESCFSTEIPDNTSRGKYLNGVNSLR